MHQLAFDFTAPVAALVANNLSRSAEVQRNCCNGTPFERGMQAFVDWFHTGKKCTDQRHGYRIPEAAKYWGMFIAYFPGSSGMTPGKDLVGYIDDTIPRRLCEMLGLTEI